jgi:hypothetical protein
MRWKASNRLTLPQNAENTKGRRLGPERGVADPCPSPAVVHYVVYPTPFAALHILPSTPSTPRSSGPTGTKCGVRTEVLLMSQR